MGASIIFIVCFILGGAGLIGNSRKEKDTEELCVGIALIVIGIWFLILWTSYFIKHYF